MGFKFTIKTDNAAFADGNLHHEVSRLLRRACVAIDEGAIQVTQRDLNGNAVGSFELDEPDDEEDEDDAAS